MNKNVSSVCFCFFFPPWFCILIRNLKHNPESELNKRWLFKSYDHAEKKLTHQVDIDCAQVTWSTLSNNTCVHAKHTPFNHLPPSYIQPLCSCPSKHVQRYLWLCGALLQPAADLWSLTQTHKHTPTFQWALQHQSFQIPGCWHKGSGEAERGGVWKIP